MVVSGDEIMSAETKNVANKENIHKPEKWEIDIIGDFLLKMYRDQQITHRNNWMVSKIALRQHFEKFLDNHNDQNLRIKIRLLYGKVDIGTLLFRMRFLIHTPRGSDYFRIKGLEFFKYYNQTLNLCDERRKNGETALQQWSSGAIKKPKANPTNTESADAAACDPVLLACFEVDPNAKRYPLTYEGSDVQRILEDFELTSMGCCMCQQNFETAENFERHIEKHTDESDFELLKKMSKHKSPKLTLSYQLCKKSHYFCFTLATDPTAANGLSIVIDKIIVLQRSSMCYVHNTCLPHEMPNGGRLTFFVDSHLFTLSIEQPIVVVFHTKQVPSIRLIEQHHFMRTDDFPTVDISYSPNCLPNKKVFKPTMVLPHYTLGTDVRVALSNEFAVEMLQRLSAGFADYIEHAKLLTLNNHGQTLQILLQIEDMATISAYSGLLQRHVTLIRNEKEYTLKLETNKRNVDSILSPYDEVLIVPESGIIQLSGNDEDIENKLIEYCGGEGQKEYKGNNKKMRIKYYKGMIERTANRRVTFVCNQNLPVSTTFALVFQPARLPVRYQYRALQVLADLPLSLRKSIFFPDVQPKPAVSIDKMYTSRLDLQNKMIYDNPEQYQAVLNITLGTHTTAPFIIFGPPGTGKTTTITEAILQLYLHRPDAKILVTAGSNSACDEIALRLCQVLAPLDQQRPIVRIYSRSNERRIDNIDELVLEYSNMYSSQFYPDIEVLHSYRIVVCTLTVVGKLSTGRFGRTEADHRVFTHVFVDEASASTEIETLVGIVGTIAPSTRLIISGDHKQLGPVLQSPRAEQLGLGVSLMERLMARECYAVRANGDYDRSIQTRLCRNFRSHAAIVYLYSKMFYNGELLPLAKNDDVRLCEKWHKAPRLEYPIIFHSVFGIMERPCNSTSMYNLKELQIVMDYVKDLMYFGVNGRQIKETDIGIISPYKLQYQRIQEELNLRNWYRIETGSVETFQGREKLIIIVSFVRSFTCDLGFLDNPRRLNVVLSRPKSLLILIGNPTVLKRSDDFKRVIDECERNKTRVGTDERVSAKPRTISLSQSLEHVDAVTTEHKTSKDQSAIQSNKTAKKKYKKKNKGQGANGANNNKDDESHQTHLDKQVKPIAAQSFYHRDMLTKYREQIESDLDAMQGDSQNKKTPIPVTSHISNSIDLDQMFDELPHVPGAIRSPVCAEDRYSSTSSYELKLMKQILRKRFDLLQGRQAYISNNIDQQCNDERKLNVTADSPLMTVTATTSPVTPQSGIYNHETPLTTRQTSAVPLVAASPMQRTSAAAQANTRTSTVPVVAANTMQRTSAAAQANTRTSTVPVVAANTMQRTSAAAQANTKTSSLAVVVAHPLQRTSAAAQANTRTSTVPVVAANTMQRTSAAAQANTRTSTFAVVVANPLQRTSAQTNTRTLGTHSQAYNIPSAYSPYGDIIIHESKIKYEPLTPSRNNKKWKCVIS